MYLANLDLHGFKSFATKTHVVFDTGITAIVGPNGCGKSNIVDALRWVLGEQKPTLLRSASMTNVIFNGTANKKALGMADVSVTIHNNKGILPTEYTDITITRRLFRSGESEYLLNNTPCRLKDIIELFMDTGLGSGAYSVIELKMVEEILNDKNDDRRRLFEEAAGVTKYKEKRKQTFRKLESTKEDLQRLDDILVIIRKNVRSLQLQAGRAAKAKEYSAELRHLELGFSTYEFNRITDSLDPLKDKMVEAEKNKDQLARTLSQLEESMILTKELLIKKEDKLKGANSAYNNVINELRETETTLRITREKINNEEQTIKQYELDIYQSEKEIKDLKNSITYAQKELKPVHVDFTDVEKTVTEALASFEDYQNKTREKQDELRIVSQKHQQTNVLLNQKETIKIRLESRIENNLDEYERLERQLELAQNDIKGLSDSNGGLPDQLTQAQSELEQIEDELEQARHKRESLTSEINSTKDTIRIETSRIDSVESEIHLLQNIAKSNEVYPSSVQFLVGTFSELKPVSEVLSTSEEFAVALESVLGNALNFLVSPTLEYAQRATAVLKKEQKGRVTFIPLDLLSHHSNSHPDSFYHIVECDSKYDPVKQLLLSNVIPTESIDSKQKNDDLIYVTKDGDVLTNQALYKAGSINKNTGMRVGLKDKIEKLEQKATVIDTSIKSLNRALLGFESDFNTISLSALNDKTKEAQAKVRKVSSELSSQLAQRSVLEKNVNTIMQRMQNLEEARKIINKEMDELIPRIDVLQKELDTYTEQEFELKNSLERIIENRNRAQSRYNDVKIEYQKKLNLIENYKRDVERDEKSIATIKERLKLRAENAKASKDNIIEYRTRIEQLNSEISALQELKNLRQEELDEAELATSKERGKINQLDQQLRDTQRSKEQNTELLHQLDMAKSRYDMELKSITDHIWETYNLIIEDIDVDMPEETDPQVVKQTITSLKEKLKNIGEVNPLAIKEHEEEQEKLTFYEEQIADLREAETKLRQTIAEINESAHERFLKTFHDIRTNFIDVFHTLFEESDNCELRLIEDEEDPLNSKIEIIAQPRGKRPSHINQLSGGEKTLTAIALLFAIYLVKPSPFCILDEVDAPLDDANIERFGKILHRFSENTQFIVITHNKKTMEKAERMYGVTMQETGVSSLVGVEMDKVPV